MKIAFTGSHSTGKTTLLESLISKGLNIYAITEVARTIIKKGFPLGEDAIIDSYIHYVNEQLKAESEALKSNCKYIISDRTILDAVVYSIVNKSLPRPFIPEYLIEMLHRTWLLERSFYDIYVYFPIEFTMEADSIRPEGEEYRQEIDKQILSLLRSSNTRFITVTGSVQERTESLLNYLIHQTE